MVHDELEISEGVLHLTPVEEPLTRAMDSDGWAPAAPLAFGDVTGDGAVNLDDLNALLSRWGEMCS